MIEFFASLPPIQSAIMISGDGDLMRIKLDVPLHTSPDAVRLMTMTQKRLKVTVEELEKQTGTYGKSELEAGDQRQSKWTTVEEQGAD